MCFIFWRSRLRKHPTPFSAPATQGGIMKSAEEIQRTLIMCILRQLKTMTLEELRQVYTKTCEICDSKKKNSE